MSNSAHSLLELLVTFALIAILAAVCVLGYAYYTEQARIASDEAYVAQVYHLIEVENQGNAGAIWINVSDGTLAFCSYGMGSDPVQDPIAIEETMPPCPLQSNTYTRGGAQYLTYDGEAFRTASGNVEDLAILWAIYDHFGASGEIELVITANGTVDAVLLNDRPQNDLYLTEALSQIRLTSDAFKATTISSADGITWQTSR